MIDKRARLDPPAEALSTYLRWRLDVLGLTPTELADRAGVARSTFYRLLGDRPPETVKTDQLVKLADALEIDPLALAGLWHGIGVGSTATTADDKEAIIRGFVLATAELSPQELRAALEVARAAAGMVKPKGHNR